MLTPNQHTTALGTLVAGRPYTFNYTLTNTGKEKVSVKSIHTGCSKCTVASLDTNSFLPGQSATLNATFTPISTGLQVKTITINYEPGNHILTLKFTADVK